MRAARDLPPVNGTFPTTEWQAGDLVRDPHALALPADLPAGSYRLVAGLYDPASGARLSPRWRARMRSRLGRLQVAARARVMEQPALGTPTDIPFGTRARLAQVASPDSLEAGGTLTVTLLWQATESGGAPLRAFAQLYRDTSQIAVSDHPLDPPASAWLQGEWIVDPHTLDASRRLAAR